MKNKLKNGLIALLAIVTIGCICACEGAETPNSTAQTPTSFISESVSSETLSTEENSSESTSQESEEESAEPSTSEENSVESTEKESSSNNGIIELPEDKFD